MKKLLMLAFTMLLAASLSFAQSTGTAGSGDTTKKTTKTKAKSKGKKGSKKGGKKATDATAPAPK